MSNYVSNFNVLGQNIKVKDNECHTLVEKSLFSPFAQVMYTNKRIWNYTKYQQGFCIGNVKNRPVCCNCFTDNTSTGSTNVIVFTYMDNGQNIGRYTIPSGHCNSCTYNKTTGNFMIACSGGNSTVNTILEVSVNGGIKHTYTLGDSAWAIAYNSNKIYVMTGENTLTVCNANNMNKIKTFNVSLNSNYVYQGMFADDLYIYLPNGNTRTLEGTLNRNFIDVYTHNGKFYKTIELMFPLEIEECDIYNDVCYLASNTQGVGFICKTDLYRKNANGFLGDTLINNNNKITYTINVNETYNGFFMNGSTSNPYSSLLWWNFLMPSNTSVYVINAQSDILTHSFANFSQTNYYVQFNGNGHKLLRINYNCGKKLTISNVTIVGEPNSTFIYIEADKLYMNNVNIGEANTNIICSKALEIYGNYQFENITINCSTNGKSALLYIIGDGYLRKFKISNNVTVGYTFLCGVIDVDGNFPIVKINNSNYYGISYKINMTLNEDLDLKKLLYPCTLNVVTNTVHFTNAPTGFNDSNIIGIVCENIGSNKSLITLTKLDGAITQFVNRL